MKNRSFRKYRGFTLTELAIVIGVTGFITAAIWQAASYTYLNMKLNKTTQQLMMVVSNVRALYGMSGNMKQPNFADITAQLVGAGVFPPDVEIRSDGLPYHPFGGEMKIEAQGNCLSGWTLGTCDTTSFEIELYPSNWTGAQNPCSAILTRILGVGRDPGLMAVYDNTSGWREPSTIVPRNINPNCSYISLAYKLRIQ